MTKWTIKISLIFLLALSILRPEAVSAFPADDNDWIPIYYGSAYMGDPDNDANPDWANLVGDATYPAVYTYNDGTYVYYRMRIDADPTGPGGLDSFGWGIQINTDADPGTYEYMVMIDGISEELRIGQNTNQTAYDDPSDKTEVDLWIEPLVNGVNYRVVSAPSNFDSDADFFLDFRFPYDTFLAFTGLTEESIVSYFIGTSNSTQNLTTDLGALILSAGFSDEVLTTGQRPATGNVRFVYSNISSANWNDDVTEAYPEDVIYIRVEDNDKNNIQSQVQTLTVTIATQGGDSETVTLTETGAATGIFTGYIATTTGAISSGNGTLQVSPVETATVTYVDAADADLNTNQTRTDTLLVKTRADLSLSKTINNPTPYANYTVIYTLKVYNNGPSYSSGAQVYDLLPTGVTYVSDDSSGQYNETTGIWYVPILFSNESTILNITATVDGTPTTVSNFANITTASQPDPDTSNDSASATFSIGGADLDLTKSVVGDTTPAVGEAVQYLLTVTNNGDNTATGIEITDHIPAFLSYSGSTTSAGTYSDATGIWTIASLSNGSSATLNIFANVTGGSGQTITNFANISSADQADPDSANNSDSAAVYVGGTDISISKTKSSPAGDPNEGDTVIYTITASNSNDATATNVRVQDVLPSGITYVSYSSTQGAFINASSTWYTGSLAPSASAVLTLRATVNAGTSGDTITNTASKSFMDQLDTNTANDSAGVSFLVQAADISINKIVDDPSANSGEPIQYTITATNNGPSNATNVEVTDQLPAGIIFSGYSTSPAGSTYNNISGLWHAGSIDNGSSAVLTIFANVTTGLTASTTFYNTAVVTGADQSDPNIMNNSDLATVVALATDIEVFKTVDNQSPGEGNTINYRVSVVNNGPTNVTNLIINDAIPAGVTYSSDAPSQGEYKTTGKTADQWYVGTVLTNMSAYITFTATVDTGTSGQTITNTATILSADQGDYDISNNSANISIVVGSTDLSVSKFANLSTATLGDTLTYTVTVSNIGTNSASGILIEDLLPSGMTYSSYSSTQGSFNNVSGLWNAGTVAGSASATLTLNATVDNTSCGWTLTNTASLYAVDVSDPNSSNNSASASTAIKCADLQVVKIANDATPDEGATVTYTITVTNNGPHNTSGIEVTDVLDSDLTFVSYSSAFGAYTGNIWTVPTLANLASANLYIKAIPKTGTGGSNIPNTATITTSSLTDPTPGNNSSTITITPNAMPLITLAKMVAMISDPVNGGTNPKAIPGAVVEYTLSATNTGLGAADAGSVIITDPIPANTEFYAWDQGGWPVIFTNGATASGLTYTFTSLGDGGDNIEFLDSGDNPITPTAGFDASVAKIKITFGGSFNASDGVNHPSFNLKFRVRIK